jgi:hypothetical protein
MVRLTIANPDKLNNFINERVRNSLDMFLPYTAAMR